MQFAALFFVVCLAAFANAALPLVQALKVKDDTCDCNQCSADCVAAGNEVAGFCGQDGQCYCVELAKTLGFAIPNIAKVNADADTCECNLCSDYCFSAGYKAGFCYQDYCYCTWP